MCKMMAEKISREIISDFIENHPTQISNYNYTIWLYMITENITHMEYDKIKDDFVLYLHGIAPEDEPDIRKLYEMLYLVSDNKILTKYLLQSLVELTEAMYEEV